MRVHRPPGSAVRLTTAMIVVAGLVASSTGPAEPDSMVPDSTATLAPDSTSKRAHAKSVWTRLPNGLRLMVVEDPTADIVHILQYYGVGSAQEPPGKEGIAHLLEHLMFGAWDSELKGDRALELYTLDRNAHTSFATTLYESWCLLRFMPEVLKLEAGRLERVEPPPDVFEREKFVVREELALRNRVSPEADLKEAILQAAYPDHPYGRPIGGTDSSVASISIRDVQEFHARFVSPENATLVVLGPVRYADVHHVAKETFGAIPSKPDFVPVEHPEPPEHRRATTQIDRHDAENLDARMGFRLPARSKQEILMGLLVHHLLSGPRTRESLTAMPNEWFFSVGGGWFYSEDAENIRPNQLRQYAWNSLWQGVNDRRRVATRPDSFEVYRQRALERMGNATSLIPLLGSVLVFQQDTSWFTQRDSIIRAFTRDDVNEYMNRWITLDNSSSGVVHGRKSRRMLKLDLASLSGGSSLGAQARDPRLDVTSAEIEPVLSELGQAPRPLVTRRILSNGIPLFCIPHSGVPEVRLGGVKTLPYVKHAEKKPGLVRLYDLVLNADPKPGSRAWERLPHGVWFDATTQSLTFSGEGPASRVERVAQVMVDRIERQEFNVATWRLLRDRASYYLRPKSHWPDLEARVQRWSALLGEDHPMLGQWRGDERQVSKWKYDHLREIHRDIMKTGNLRLVATGRLEPDSLQARLEPTFGTLKRFRRRDKWVNSESASTAPFLSVVSAFDRRDCRIAFTFRPVPHLENASLDWPTLEIVRECIRSQVFSRLRHREGLSYTVRTTLDRAGDSVVLGLEASTFPAATERTIAAALDELRQLAQSGIDEDLLARAKLTVARRLLRALNDHDDAFRVLQRMALFGDPPDDPIAAVIAVGRAPCEALLQTCLNPASPIVSVCGPILEEESETLAAAIGSGR